MKYCILFTFFFGNYIQASAQLSHHQIEPAEKFLKGCIGQTNAEMFASLIRVIKTEIKKPGECRNVLMIDNMQDGLIQTMLYGLPSEKLKASAMIHMKAMLDYIRPYA